MHKNSFHHNIYSHYQENIDFLILKGGPEAYGRLWLLIEHIHVMQIHEKEISKTIQINQASLVTLFKTKPFKLKFIFTLFQDAFNIEIKTEIIKTNNKDIILYTIPIHTLLTNTGILTP